MHGLIDHIALQVLHLLSNSSFNGVLLLLHELSHIFSLLVEVLGLWLCASNLAFLDLSDLFSNILEGVGARQLGRRPSQASPRSALVAQLVQNEILVLLKLGEELTNLGVSVLYFGTFLSNFFAFVEDPLLEILRLLLESLL